MDEVSNEGKIWTKTLSDQKKVLDNLDLTLSDSLLKEIKDGNVSFQEYGHKLSLSQKENMNNIENENKYSFQDIAKESLITASKLEQEKKINFEDYLKEFLNKIS